MATITAANAVLMLSIPDLYPVPQQIQGFSTDDSFTADAVSPLEHVMGVDGHLSFGRINVEYPMTISLQADSASNNIFDDWSGAQLAAGDTYVCNATIRLPSIGRVYSLTRGGLMTYTPMPAVKKTLQFRTYGIVWESITSAPL